MEEKYVYRGRLDLDDMKAMARMTSRWQIIAACVLLVLSLAFALWLKSMGDPDSWEFFLFAAFFALCILFFSVIYPRLMLRSTNKKTGEFTYTFTDDEFIIKSDSSDGRLKYNAFVKLVETNTHFFLYTQKNIATPLAKAKFIQGDPNTFMAFMEDRTGLKAKHK